MLVPCVLLGHCRLEVGRRCPKCTAQILLRRSRNMPPLQWPTLSPPGTLCVAASELGAEHRQSVEGRHAVAEYSFAVQLEGHVMGQINR